MAPGHAECQMTGKLAPASKITHYKERLAHVCLTRSAEAWRRAACGQSACELACDDASSSLRTSIMSCCCGIYVKRWASVGGIGLLSFPAALNPLHYRRAAAPKTVAEAGRGVLV